MTSPSHPATTLSDLVRVDYFRAVASVAATDGFVDRSEVAKLHRLAAVLSIPADVADAQIAAVQKGAGQGRALLVATIRDDVPVRTSLMMDSLVIALADGKLAPGESKALGGLARDLGMSREAMIRLAAFVEKVVSNKESDAQVLARDLGTTLDAGQTIGWLAWARQGAAF